MIILTNDGGPTSATVLSSDKGVGFSFVPNNNGAVSTTVANADCGLSATICISITTEEDNLFRGPPIDDAPDEVICVIYTTHPPTSKTPQLAWAGQRMVVEHFWGDIDESGDMVCPYATVPTDGQPRRILPRSLQRPGGHRLVHGRATDEPACRQPERPGRYR